MVEDRHVRSNGPDGDSSKGITIHVVVWVLLHRPLFACFRKVSTIGVPDLFWTKALHIMYKYNQKDVHPSIQATSVTCSNEE